MSIRTVLIGAGKYGPIHFNAFSQMKRRGQAELVAFAARTEETVKARSRDWGMPGYTDWRKMLQAEEPDAVVVATPDHLHREMTVTALDMGLPVLVEKPMDVTVAGAAAMLKAARNAHVLLQVDMHKRFDSYHRKLYDMIQQGSLGEIQYGYAWAEEKIFMPRDWFRGWAEKSSPAWLVGSHMADLLCWMIKQAPEKVYAAGQKGKLTSMGLDTYDSIQMMIQFSGGSSVTVDTSWILPDSFEGSINQGLRIVGTEGFMEIDSQDRGAGSCLTGGAMESYNMAFQAERREWNGEPVFSGYAVESIESFVKNLKFLAEGASLDDLEGHYPSAEEGLTVVAVIAAAHLSLKENRPVAITEVLKTG